MAKLGKKKSEETKKRMSFAQSNMSMETRKKMSLSKLNRNKKNVS